MRKTRSWPVPFRALGVLLLSVPFVVGCPSPPKEPPPPEPVACPPARSNERIPMRRAAARATTRETFSNMVERMDALCGECHRAPNTIGNFSYTPDRASLQEKAGRMAERAIQGSMPPGAPAETQKEAVELGRVLQAWLAQGAPEGTFTVTSGGDAVEDPSAPEVAEAMTDLGNCIPPEELLGSDPEKDAFFAGLTALPRTLAETDSDIMTFDAAKLARHGTFAFAPTYQLFSDHAKKLRLVHVPAGSSIEYDPVTKKFKIPPNTRFYKTFFKEVKGTDGTSRYRKIETRLIVTRERWQDTLFGTYIWNEEGTAAELHELRYRDGTPFSDRVLVYQTDEATGATRNYAVPGRHRCINCHQGAEARNFILGFTPLELNRRARGEGGLDATVDVLADELSQVDRLIRYGVITGLRSAEELPRLETSVEGHTPTPQELALQAYFVPNCAQCHNPNGFAVESNPSIEWLDFSAGGMLFGWKPFGVRESNGQRYYVAEVADFSAELRNPEPTSALYQRVARDTNERIIHMPANVPGKDCRAALLVAEWIASLDWPERDRGLTPEQKQAAKQERLQQARATVASTCDSFADVRWIGEDFTDKVPYEPRNTSWKAHIGQGPFEYLTRYPITDAHEQLARKPFPTNWWSPKAECGFDAQATAPDPIGPWMVDELGNPILPWGYLYHSTPGATVYQGVCANCHGRAGDGQSGAAKTLVAFNGARVADLVKGLFGTSSTGEPHRKMFEDEYGAHGGARYLVWMAAGGTSVEFTEEFMQAWVKYGEVDIDFSPDLKDWAKWGANMLGAARGACDLVRAGKLGTGSLEPHSGNRKAIGGATMWKEICTLDNPLTDEVRNGTNPDAVEEWLQHAQFNAGVMAYFYLRDARDDLARGQFFPLRTECEKR